MTEPVGLCEPAVSHHTRTSWSRPVSRPESSGAVGVLPSRPAVLQSLAAALAPCRGKELTSGVSPQPDAQGPAVVRPERRKAGAAEVANLWGIDEVSSYLGVPKHSIYGWRKTGYGPPPVKIGKHLKWRPAAVVEWVRQQERPAG